MFNVRIASAFALVAIATSLAAPAHAAPGPGGWSIYSWLESLPECAVTFEMVVVDEEHDVSIPTWGLECCHHSVPECVL